VNIKFMMMPMPTASRGVPTRAFPTTRRGESAFPMGGGRGNGKKKQTTTTPKQKQKQQQQRRRTQPAAGTPKGKRAETAGKTTDTATGTVYYRPNEAMALLGRREARPVLRVGAEAQTLPPPNEKLVTEKKMSRVEYESSSVEVSDAPKSDGLPEVALIGRSNVGKSSLLNLVTFGRGAAVVSAKPGTTVSMNHYLVDKKWRLVDLPGYGYAKAEEDAVKAWDAFTKEYFVERENLAGVLLLVDASIPPTKNDEAYANWLIEHDTPFTIIFTKCDRNKPGGPTVEENKAALRDALDAKWHRLPSMISTSSVTTEGRGEVLKFISSLIVFRRQRNEERKKMARREKVRALKDARYEAKGVEMGKRRDPKSARPSPRKPPTRADDFDEEEDEEDWEDEEDYDDDDEPAFTMKQKGKGSMSMQDLIRAELEEINREGR
jgi:GTP-binding protein